MAAQHGLLPQNWKEDWMESTLKFLRVALNLIRRDRLTNELQTSLKSVKADSQGIAEELKISW